VYLESFAEVQVAHAGDIFFLVLKIQIHQQQNRKKNSNDQNQLDMVGEYLVKNDYYVQDGWGHINNGLERKNNPHHKQYSNPTGEPEDIQIHHQCI
jgi:hypothetical protein